MGSFLMLTYPHLLLCGVTLVFINAVRHLLKEGKAGGGSTFHNITILLQVVFFLVLILFYFVIEIFNIITLIRQILA